MANENIYQSQFTGPEIDEKLSATGVLEQTITNPGDIAAVDGKLQFADREYDAENPDGLGYKILRKDATFAEQVTDTNTIYEIRYDFDLNNASVSIPAGCVLKFNGGKISNGEVAGADTQIDADICQIFNGVSFIGTWNVEQAPVEWCGTKVDDADDRSAGESVNVLQSITDVVVFQEGIYRSDTMVVLTKKIAGKRKGRNKTIGSTLIFYMAQNDFVCVQVGDPASSASNRTNEVSVSDLAIYTSGQASHTGGSVVTISNASQVLFENCSLQNQDARTSEFSDPQLSDAPSYCGYAVKCTGSSEFVRFNKVGFLGDICFYSDGASLDFTSFTDCVFAAGPYGFGGLYITGVFSNPTLSRCSFNQGIYGIYITDTSFSALAFYSGRFEQLRNKSVGGTSITSCIRVIMGAIAYNTVRASMLLSNVYFAIYRGVNISGDEQLDIVMDSCVGFNLSNAAPFIDIASAKSVYIKAVSCAMLGQVLVKYSEATHTLSGLRLRNQQNAAYAGTIHNMQLSPIRKLSELRNDFTPRLIASSNRGYSIKFDEAIATGNRLFVDRLKLWDNDNKCVGYKIEIEVIAPGIYGKATYYVKYGYANSAIDPTNATIAIIEHSGDDIFATATGTDKLAFYISSAAGSSTQVSVSNSTGGEVHVIGTLTAFTNSSLVTT